MDEQIIPVCIESTDSNESLETCIICLDEVNENTIYFPCKYSSCSCKYTIHLMCIKENNINKCVICKSAIIYPVQNDFIQIDTFKDVDVDVDVDAGANTYRHETQQGKRNCCNKKIYICIFSTILSIMLAMFSWFIASYILFNLNK
jgi:hypothetical protein